MDPSLYKDVVTSRGVTYHYYYLAAPSGRPTLLLCHGFPSTSGDWRKMVPYLQAQGYGIIAPDMLGYGGTDKPTDPAMYVGSGQARDLIDILDAENVQRVVAVGFDWGAQPVSRLANWHPERVIAYAFIVVPYMAPWPQDFHYETYAASTKEDHGREIFGYWSFFSRDDVDQILQDHIESFHSLLYPSDPEFWIERLAKSGGIEKTLEEDWRAPVPSYLSDEDRQTFIETFRANKFNGPTCWYKVLVRGFSPADDTRIPASRAFPPPTAPVYFGAAKNDYVCCPEWGYNAFKAGKFKDSQVTMKEYDSDHWVILSQAEELSRDLGAWIAGFID
ncbi:hypothetical protein PHLGIDRAFT_319667 [Phlebiopsis gigantea 11061_1 CR5-6]|uniref:AB hydrolase-1 domain-containing protein n=1 Tax=Phlebiopsis gigantea (strain 11061_1 CR5-6) TaxID=745531 RepID=A0A0C3S2Q9_PHLG1|nr:hypothetical protein PHLGIDRAFT_319667 [Phlebiopsis gigantea 11061_1 CR5-6]